MDFFIGLHQPSDAKHFDRCFISVSRLRNRKGPFADAWIMDCQGFTTIKRFGGYPHPVEEYAGHIKRWERNGRLIAAVSQDYMCEPIMLKITGLTVADHQRLTIERYDGLLKCDTGNVYIMPVLQGYQPEEYVDHVRQYGDRLKPGAWVGVGSVCKRNSSPKLILDVLIAIKTERPDLRLHGFGLKTTALANGTIRTLLQSADSMAWSFAARRTKTGANDWRNAKKFKEAVGRRSAYQGHFIELIDS